MFSSSRWFCAWRFEGNAHQKEGVERHGCAESLCHVPCVPIFPLLLTAKRLVAQTQPYYLDRESGVWTTTRRNGIVCGH